MIFGFDGSGIVAVAVVGLEIEYLSGGLGSGFFRSWL